MSEDIKKGEEVTAPKGEPTDVGNDTRGTAYWESEAKKAFGERKALKEKLDALEKAAEVARSKEIEEKGLFKSELEKIKPEYEELKAFKRKYTERLEANVASLEGKLTKEHLEEYEGFIKKLDIESRKDWLERKIAAPQTAPNESPASSRPGATGKTQAKVQGMTFEQRMELMKNDPKSFRELVV